MQQEVLMNIDFHYYTVYTLCRLNGMCDQYSEIVAYSSMQVDHSKYNHPLYFEGGGRFKQIKSAHAFLSPTANDLDSMYDIYMPFHYLPGGQGDCFEQRVICKPKSNLVTELFNDTLRTINKPYGLYRLGVAFHVIADTYSHENYSGIKSIYNASINFETKEDDYDDLRKIKLFTGKLAPRIGHAHSFDLPDESNLEWSYGDYFGNRVEVNNKTAYFNACLEINEMIEKVKEFSPDLFEEKGQKLDTIIDDILRLYYVYVSADTRIELWQEAFRNGTFNFVENKEYDPKSWFYQAIEVIEYNWRERYIKKEGFAVSNWKYFQDALKVHLNYLHIELFPKYKIYV